MVVKVLLLTSVKVMLIKLSLFLYYIKFPSLGSNKPVGT